MIILNDIYLWKLKLLYGYVFSNDLLKLIEM